MRPSLQFSALRWCLLFWGGFLVAGCSTTVVYRDGRALLPVLVEKNAASDEQAAAAELGRVLGKMSGVPWPVRAPEGLGERGFYVGALAAEAWPGETLRVAPDLLAPKAGEIGPDGFRISTRDGSVFIEGATPEATYFAVSWFLQYFGGVRWYIPGPLGEIVPRQTSWKLPSIRTVREPAFVSREMTGLDGPDGERWARHNGLRGRLEFSHALGRIYSLDTLASHPGWRPLLEGRRYRPTSPEDGDWQPNLALPDVAGYAAQAATQAFAADPDRRSFALGMNDTARFDQSAATRTLVEPLRYFRRKPDYSPLVFTFMNRVAETLPSGYSNRYLGCLAYGWCENAPPFPVRPQVLPYLASDRSQYYDPSYRNEDLALMKRWGASGVRAFGLWDYAYGRHFLIPREPIAVLAEGIREGWRCGARGYFAEVEPQWGSDAFKTWMLAQLLWEPNRSATELANDFFGGFFGLAAVPMRRFFERCEKQWMAQNGTPYWLKLYQQEDQAELFPPERCAELREYLGEAAKLASADSLVAARIEMVSQAFAVTEAYVAFDSIRRKLSGFAVGGKERETDDKAALSGLLGELKRREAQVSVRSDALRNSTSSASSSTDLTEFLRNDPVPSLLWQVGQQDPSAPARVLDAIQDKLPREDRWRQLALAISEGRLANAPNLAVNSTFEKISEARHEPLFLFPEWGPLPANWKVWAVPHEAGSVRVDRHSQEGPGGILRFDGAWEAQFYQWIPCEPGRLYVATAALRGLASPGANSALYLTFLDADGKPAGPPRMQALPKGRKVDWRPAVLADVSPPGTAWVGVAVGVSRQVAGDWLEAKTVELREIESKVTP